ncbi:MAG TPA: hypothetical protein VKY54_14045 [Kiloniellales bacterium]|jgi:hypothetical protein|nr:hypothetical protein [Kiloniellales bacterium]
MLSLDMLLSLFLLAAFHAFLVLALPFVPLAAGTRLISLIQNARLPLTPVIETAALAVGVLLGSFLLAQHLPAGALSLTDVFTPASHWNIGLKEFLFERANPSAFPLMEVLVPGVADQHFGPVQQGLLPALGVLLVLPLLLERGPAAVANSARNLLIAIWAAYATVYLICLFYWLLALLNFWAFLVAMLLIQFLRR